MLNSNAPAPRIANPLTQLSAAVCAGVLCLSGQVQAQETLEEIVVTAQKREQSLVDVPISVTAMSAQTLEQTGVRRLQEIAEYVPNLQIGGNSGRDTTVQIRGVGSSSRNIGFDSRVGVYVDGVYTGQSPASNQDILDLERVEVLRGPQGTLFGKNNVAGAINMITKKPAQEFGGDVRVEFGNLDSRRVTGILDVPLGDTVFTKLSVNDIARDGFVKSLNTGNKGGEQDSTTARFQLLADLNSDLEMNLALDWTKLDDQLSRSRRRIANNSGQIEPELNEFETLNNVDFTEDRELKGMALSFDWALNDGYQAKSISSYRETAIDTLSDLDAGARWAESPLPPGFPPLNIDFAFGITSDVELRFMEEYKQFTQEFQLLSPTDGDLRWVAGLYYYEQEGYSERDAISHYDPNHPFYASGRLPWPGDITYTLRTQGTVDTTSYAAYLNGEYDLGERWTLGLGARYTKEDKDVDYTMDPSDAAPDVLGVGVTLNAAFRFANDRLLDNRSDTHLSWEGSLRYDVSENSNAYYRVSTGFKSGGYNLDFITIDAWEAGIEFDKEEVISHELGIKGEVFDNRLSYGLALFYAEYEDYQVQQFLESADGVAGAAVIGNASEVETTGLEFEMKALLMPNLILDFAVGLLDAKYKDFPGGDRDNNGNTVNLKGNRLPGSPEHTLNLGLQYYLPVETFNAEALFRIDYAYSGDVFGGGNNREEKTRRLADGSSIDYRYIKDRRSLNARIGLKSENGNWYGSIWGRNLTNENDYFIGEDIFGTYGTLDSLPRTYGIEVGYRL
ncbi:TonB-dependent receptor [Pseudoteredinibacter isoporae]|uniref:Iron complex outermembrane receptor protein n=1 Tax=Pseudoteredinibacter isoporae TaxID=570281 RepID=A0A7X0JTS7_9GAMM|nr:TonB-dependent receptor [Pseudoteredinibacter isoporae]MBB6521305.1 iron complex outermembrane receptor protein [Pseudoteredinibacter isoporae]NHO86862.1 TonB-dependent receptor [Pseudoteredinibacter isoporae]NIB24686.1 TonB-dependent receptor [Pseudoteredinibacter isoporae]